jgi:alkylation response protein AidB-like acyl-CoA dehydrogenase
MDFTLTSEQEALASSVRRFVEREYSFEQRRKLINSEEGFSRAHWAFFAELGWLGAGLSEEMGGYGGSAIEYAIVAERLGKALAVEPFAAMVTAVRTLEAIERNSRLIALIEQIVTGEKIAVLAHGEAGARGDPRIVETIALRSADGWRLKGVKSLVAPTPGADSLIVSARINDCVGLFLVASNAEGIRTMPYRTVDNLRAGDLHFDNVTGELLALGPSVMAAIEMGIDHGTVTLCAEAVGVMEAALWMTRDYLKTRQQFAQPIGNFQALQHRMADMLIQFELARSMLYQGLFSLGQSDDARRRGVSAMKTIVAEAGLFVGRQAIQLHGGIAMTEEYIIGHYYKRLFAIAHLHGDQDTHIERFALLAA